MNERKYIAISLKHSDGYPFILWGYHRTKDEYIAIYEQLKELG